jgi:uncharacterized membrane protein
MVLNTYLKNSYSIIPDSVKMPFLFTPKPYHSRIPACSRNQKMETTSKAHLQALGLGAIAGMRSMAAPAILSHYLSHDPAGSLYDTKLRYLQRPLVATGLKLLAGLEVLGDKLPTTPDRTSPPQVTARLLSGAVVGATVAGANKESKAVGALLGMAGALAATYGFYYLRKKLGQKSGLPNLALGLMEDALAASGGIAILKK